MTGITPEMTGNQHSCLSPSKIDQKCKQDSWLPTISFASFLLKHMGLHPLQDCKERRCHDQRRNKEELVSFLQESTGAVHPLLNFAVHFDLAITWQRLTKSTGSTATLQIHGRCNTNHKSNQNRSTMGLFLDRFRYTQHTSTLSKVCWIDGNGIFLQVAGVSPILTILFFFIHELVVDREDNVIPFDNLLQRQVELTAMAYFVGVAGRCTHSHHLFLYSQCSSWWSTMAFLLSAAVAVWSSNEAWMKTMERRSCMWCVIIARIQPNLKLK